MNQILTESSIWIDQIEHFAHWEPLFFDSLSIDWNPYKILQCIWTEMNHFHFKNRNKEKNFFWVNWNYTIHPLNLEFFHQKSIKKIIATHLRINTKSIRCWAINRNEIKQLANSSNKINQIIRNQVTKFFAKNMQKICKNGHHKEDKTKWDLKHKTNKSQSNY